MLFEEFNEIAHNVFADYRRLGIESLAQATIQILRSRSSDDTAGYQKATDDLRIKIDTANLRSNPYLKSSRVRHLFEQSEYAGLLPSDILAKIASFIPPEFDFAASSSEAEALLARIQSFMTSLGKTISVALSFAVDFFKIPKGTVLLDLTIPEEITEGRLSTIAKTLESFDKFFFYAGEFLEGSPIQPKVEHLSGSSLVIFLSFGGPAALLVIKIWNELMKAAKSTLEAKAAISNFKLMGAEQANADAMLEQMTEKIYERLREDLNSLSKLPTDKVSEARHQEITQIFNSHITYVVEKIELGVKLELDNRGDSTIKALTNSNEPLHIEQTGQIISDQQLIQAQVERAIEQRETRLIPPPATK